MPHSRKGLAGRIAALKLSHPEVVEAFDAIDRADFVPAGARGRAYQDRPIEIPGGQTTSQPSLIAHMIDAAHPGPGDKVLEVGTGFGFQTALLAHLSERVVSIDRMPELVEAARRNLERAGIAGATVQEGDGWQGVAEEAPFDAIIVSAAATSVPDPLVDQLAEGGRLVIPVKKGGSDDVLLYVKNDGKLVLERLISPARFVPLVQEMTT